VNRVKIRRYQSLGEETHSHPAKKKVEKRRIGKTARKGEKLGLMKGKQPWLFFWRIDEEILSKVEEKISPTERGGKKQRLELRSLLSTK